MAGDYVAILFKSEVPGIEQMKLQIFQIALVRVSSLCGEDVVILSPDHQRRRLMLTEVGLPLRIKQWVRTVIVEQLKLNCFVARAIQEILVPDPIAGTDRLYVSYPVGVLPLARLKVQKPEVAPGKSGRWLRCIPPTEEGYAMSKGRRFSGELKARIALEAPGDQWPWRGVLERHRASWSGS